MLRSPCESFGGAGCTLPGGIESVPSLTMVGIGVVAWKPSQDNGGTCKALDMSRLDLFEISLFNVDA